MKKKTVKLFFLYSLVIIISIYFFFFFTANLIFSSAVKNSVNADIRISAAGFNLRGLVLKKIHIRNSKGNELAYIGRALIGIDIIKIIKFKPISALKKIELSDINIYITRENDRIWNISDLIKEKDIKKDYKGLSDRFSGKIKIINGSVIVKDLFIAECETCIENINSSLDFIKDGVLVSFTALNKKNNSRISISGNYDAKFKNTKLRIISDSLLLTDFINFSFSGKDFLAYKGSFNIDTLITNSNFSFVFKGGIRLNDAAFRIKGCPYDITQVNGSIGFYNDGLAINDIKGKFGSIPVLFSGSISDFSNPYLFISTKKAIFDIKELEKFWKHIIKGNVKGRCAAEYELWGPLWAIEYKLKLNSTRISVAETFFNSARLTLISAGSSIFFQDINADNGYGSIKGRGWYFFSKPESVYFNINLYDYPFKINNYFKPLLSGKYVVMGSAKKPLLIARAVISNVFESSLNALISYYNADLIINNVTDNEGGRKVFAKGYIDIKNKHIDLYADSGGLNIKKISFKNGSLKGMLNIQGRLTGQLNDFNFWGIIRNSFLDFNGQKFYGINTNIIGKKDIYAAQCSMNFNNSLLNINGYGKKNNFAFNGYTGSVSLKSFMKDIYSNRNISIKDRFSADFSGYGNSKKLIYGISLNNNKDIVNVKGALSLNKDNKNFSLVSVRDLMIKGFDQKVDGTINGEGLIFNSKNNISSFGNLNYNGCIFKKGTKFSLNYFFENTEGITELKNCTLNSEPASLNVKGIVGKDKAMSLDYSLFITDLCFIREYFPEIIKKFGWNYINAEAVSKGSIKGKLNDISLSSDIVSRGIINSQNFSVDSRLKYAKKKLKINEFNYFQDCGSLLLNGLICFEKKFNYSMLMKLNEFSIEKFLDVTPFSKKNIFGYLNADVSLNGDLKKISSAGEVEGHGLKFNKQSIKEFDLKYHSMEKRINIENFYILVDKGNISGSGTTDSDGNLDFKVSSQNFPLNEIPFLPSYFNDLKGDGSFDLKISGKYIKPVGELNIKAKDIFLKGQVFNELTANLLWKDATLFFNPMLLTFAKEFYTVTGNIYFPDNTIPVEKNQWLKNANAPFFNMQFITQNASVSKILALTYGKLKDKIDASVDSKINFNGSLNNPDIDLNLDAKNARLGSNNIASVQLNAIYRDKGLNIDKFNVDQKNGSISASGVFNFNDQPSSFVMKSSLFNIACLTPFLPFNYDLGGKLNSSLQVSGLLYNWKLLFDFGVLNPVYGSYQVDSIKGRILGEKGVLNLDNITFAKGAHKTLLNGKMPMIIRRGRYFTSSPIDITMSLNDNNLDVMNIFGNVVKSSSARVDGKFNITGPLNDYKVEGNLTVKNADIQLIGLSNEIQNFSADISLKEDYLGVNKFKGKLGKGTFELKGGIKMKDLTPVESDLILVMNSVQSALMPYFQGNIDGNVKLSGSFDALDLDGKINISDGSVKLDKMKTKDDKSISENNFINNMKCDLEVALKNVWIDSISPIVQIYLKSRGDLKFSGNISKPALSGNVSFNQGSLNFYNTKFKVLDGSASFSGSTSWEPDIDIESKTSIGDVDIFLDIKGNIHKPNWDATSDPPLTRTEILSLIAGKMLPLMANQIINPNTPNSVTSPLNFAQSAVSQLIFNTLGSALLQPIIGSWGTENLFGDINIGMYQPGAWSMTIAKALDPEGKLLLTYSRTFSPQGTIISLWGLEYKFQKKMTLKVATDELGDYYYGIQARYQFD